MQKWVNFEHGGTAELITMIILTEIRTQNRASKEDIKVLFIEKCSFKNKHGELMYGEHQTFSKRF